MKVAILSGSVYGTAEDVARHAERQLKAAGFDAWHDPRAQLQQILDFAPDALLVVTSTTGMGELPDSFIPLYTALRDRFRPGAAGLVPSSRWATPVTATPSVAVVN